MENNQLIKSVIKQAYAVHNELGIGFLEKIYEGALHIALAEAGFDSKRQAPISVYFRGQVVGEYFADLLVEDELIVELKAVKALQNEHMAQLINYLKATGKKSGLLINFGVPGLEIKKAYLPKV